MQSMRELAEDLHARTVLSERDVTGIMRVIVRALDDRTSQLVTRDQFDARFAEVDAKFSDLKTEIAELHTELKTDIAVVRTEITNLRADMERTIRMQTVWLAGTMVAVAGLVVTLTKKPDRPPGQTIPSPRARSVVEESGVRGPCRNTQAGARRRGNVRAASSRIRPRPSAIAVLADVAEKVNPGRSITATGTVSSIRRHRRQRWKEASESAPISHTNRTSGARRTRKATVSAV